MNNQDFLQGIYQKYEEEKKQKKNSFYTMHVYQKESKMMLKTVAIFLLMFVMVTGVIYAGMQYVQKRIEMQPSNLSGFETSDMNDIWVGTFQLIWNDAMNEIIGGPIEFVDYDSKLAQELNKQSFTEDMLSTDSYYKKCGVISDELRQEIETGIQEKFGEKSAILDRLPWTSKGQGYILYTMLKKNFHFFVPFEETRRERFANSEEYVRYFGADASVGEETYQNIEVLFYDSQEEFAVKLKTKEGEEVLLYRTKNRNLSFEDAYQQMQQKAQAFTGKKEFTEEDILRVPYIQLSKDINYDELCNKWIKGTDLYIDCAIQTIDFELNNTGGSVKSEAGMGLLKASILKEPRRLEFTDSFYLFLKEGKKEKPYLALRVNNTDVLEVVDKPKEITSNYTEITTIE